MFNFPKINFFCFDILILSVLVSKNIKMIVKRNIVPAGFDSDEDDYDEFGNCAERVKYNIQPQEENFQLTLQNACESNNVPEIIRAQKCGSIDINCYLPSNWTALMYAAFNGSLDAVKYLLENGADPLLSYDCFNVIMCICKCNNVSNETDLLDCLKLLEDFDTIDINATDRSGYSALMYACSNGRLKIVEYLINHGADIELKDNQNGETALFIAVRFEHVNIVKYLLSHGANRDVVDKNGETVHRIAISKNMVDILDVLNGNSNEVKVQEYYLDFDTSPTYWDVVMFEIENGFSNDVKVVLESLSMEVYKNKINSKNITFKQLLTGDKNKFMEMGIILSPHRNILDSALKFFHLWNWSHYSLGIKNHNINAKNVTHNLANVMRQFYILNASLLYLETRGHSLGLKKSREAMNILQNIKTIEDNIFMSLDKHARMGQVDYIGPHKLRKQRTKICITDKVLVATTVILVLLNVI